MEEILVYKTNATENTDLSLLKSLLDDSTGIKEWNFDFEDCDHIFRLASTGISSRSVELLLSKAGITAYELEDTLIKT